MSELRNISWKKLFKDSFLSPLGREIMRKSKSPQWALTYGMRQQGMIVLDDLDNLVIEYKGCRFHPETLNYPRIFEAYDRYDINCLSKDDTVLDMGANIGSYTIPAAKRVKHLVAIEPIFYEALCKNLSLNNLSNIGVIRGAIVNQHVDCQEVKWNSLLTDIPPLPYTVIRMDIGGAEWLLNPTSFLKRPLRHFEGEFHFWDSSTKRDKKLFIKWLQDLNLLELQVIVRWSKHHHWAYVTADKEYKTSKEVTLIDGSFRGKNKELWRLWSQK